jgi:hypothetical protein
MSKIRFVGLDVQADTIAVAVAEPDGEVRPPRHHSLEGSTVARCLSSRHLPCGRIAYANARKQKTTMKTLDQVAPS